MKYAKEDSLYELKNETDSLISSKFSQLRESISYCNKSIIQGNEIQEAIARAMQAAKKAKQITRMNDSVLQEISSKSPQSLTHK